MLSTPTPGSGRKSTAPTATSCPFASAITRTAVSPVWLACSASASARTCSAPPDQCRSGRSTGSRSRTVSRSFTRPPCQSPDRGQVGRCRWLPCWHACAELHTRPGPVPRMTRYVIIGAGAIGGAIGGRLVHAGREAVLVARGDHLRALQESGLRLRTPDEDVTVPVQAVGGPEELQLRPDDVLVVATKTQQAGDALVTWSDAAVHEGGREVGTAGERLPILMALNGVASEAMALRYFSRVYGVCVWMPAVHLVPGEVIVRASPTSGMLHVGRVPARLDDRDRRLLGQVREDWSAARFDVPLPEDVLPWKYRKLISNL